MSNLKETGAIIVELFDNLLIGRANDRCGSVVNMASINEDTLLHQQFNNSTVQHIITFMKNLYFLAAIAAFVLGACTAEEALDPPAGPDDEASAIGFGTFLDETPQNGIKPLASILDFDGLKARKPGFMVNAYKSGTTTWDSWANVNKTAMPNCMDNRPVTWTNGSSGNGTWTYNPIEHWPRSNGAWEYVHLFAYSPSAATFVPNKTTSGSPQLHFTTAGDPNDQTDLIVATMYNARGSDNEGKVTFKFDHVLSRIGFRVINAYASATIAISSVEVGYSIITAGTYTFSSSTVAGGTWTYSSTESSGTYDLSTGDVPLASKGDYHDITNYLMLIPQTIDGTQMRIELKYTIDSSVEKTANLSASSLTWEPGKAYTYKLNIGASGTSKASKMSKVSVVESSGHWGSGTMNNEQ
jgi:hypothetical protein